MQNFGNMQNMPMMQNPMMQNQMMQNQMMQNQMMQNQMMQNQMMMQNPMMMQMYNNMQLQNMQKMQQVMNPQNQNLNQANKRLARIKKEFQLCCQDSDLIQIGCSFGLVNQDDYNVWKVSMIGPQNTPYASGVFTIKVFFPEEYPQKGAEFRFVNQIYHLNVDFKHEESKGHICLSTLNEWATTGKVASKSCYGVKQALFDIFCLFYNQGVDSPYDDEIAAEYRDRRKEFDAKAKEWTEKYAK
jgi:ubiquitin-conjugating enzyme E2 D/E